MARLALGCVGWRVRRGTGCRGVSAGCHATHGRAADFRGVGEPVWRIGGSGPDARPTNLQGGGRAARTGVMVARLRAAGGIEPAVRIAVLDDRMVNAPTLPGGRVLVMRGLIDKAQDGAELAGVIAHELGHVAHRDPTTLLLRQLGIGFITASLGWNDALANAGGIAQDGLPCLYSRRAEAAADAAGERISTVSGCVPMAWALFRSPGSDRGPWRHRVAGDAPAHRGTPRARDTLHRRSAATVRCGMGCCA